MHRNRYYNHIPVYFRLRMTHQIVYSATMPAAPFALDESKVIARLMLDYDSRFDVRSIVHEENLLKVKSLSNEKKLFNYIYNRLEQFPDELKQIIIYGDENDSRYVNFVSIMAYDRLFMEFVYDVYQSKRINGDPITDYDVMSFFEKVSARCEQVSEWKYETVFKLRRLYTRVLFEAGLLKTSSGCRGLCKPFVSDSTLHMLKKFGYESIIGATLG